MGVEADGGSVSAPVRPLPPVGPPQSRNPRRGGGHPPALREGAAGDGNRTTGIAGGACRRPPAGSAPRQSRPLEHLYICEAARRRGEVGRGGRPSLGRRDRARRPRPGPGGGMSLTLLEGDCRAMLPTLPAESVQCVVTSPPYWGLRDYGTASWEGGDPACRHLNGQLVSDKSTLRLDGRAH